MNLYSIFRPCLFALEPELAHTVTLKLLAASYQLGLSKFVFPCQEQQPIRVMGLDFANPVGLAAGLDKNGDYIDPLGALGFGFIEIGTVTPKPQPGNPKPRLFRLPEHDAMINRMGFNNLGLAHLLKRVENSSYQGVLGINIGKNSDTPIQYAIDDYLVGLRESYRLASYITLNISSPNTRHLRQLQQGDEIKHLLSRLKDEQQVLQQKWTKYTPLVVKIAPDLDDDEIDHIARLLLAFDIDGVIATNTTLTRDNIQGHRHAHETGGLSGLPIREQATRVVARLYDTLGDKLPIIAAGGIVSPEHAREKFDAGARLLQVYSGLIYRGPQLVGDILSDANQPDKRG